MAKTFHIRAPRPRKGAGNAFYRADEAYRVPKTLCGALMTSHDIKFGWQAFAAGDYAPCPQCVEIRRRHLATSRRASV
jgi:hypothetical protein